MSQHTFLVTVDVTGWPEDDPGYDRTEADYAHDALLTASLRDAKFLDGYADLTAEADVDDVEVLP